MRKRLATGAGRKAKLRTPQHGTALEYAPSTSRCKATIRRRLRKSNSAAILSVGSPRGVGQRLRAINVIPKAAA